ncbi:MAG: hypothetical protein MI919_42755, partial [Holophagales bacterium]|nr:hypothetical protein [Holophagales bacterium]
MPDTKRPGAQAAHGTDSLQARPEAKTPDTKVSGTTHITPAKVPGTDSLQARPDAKTPDTK